MLVWRTNNKYGSNGIFVKYPIRTGFCLKIDIKKCTLLLTVYRYVTTTWRLLRKELCSNLSSTDLLHASVYVFSGIEIAKRNVRIVLSAVREKLRNLLTPELWDRNDPFVRAWSFIVETRSIATSTMFRFPSDGGG